MKLLNDLETDLASAKANLRKVEAAMRAQGPRLFTSTPEQADLERQRSDLKRKIQNLQDELRSTRRAERTAKKAEAEPEQTAEAVVTDEVAFDDDFDGDLDDLDEIDNEIDDEVTPEQLDGEARRALWQIEQSDRAEMKEGPSFLSAGESSRIINDARKKAERASRSDLLDKLLMAPFAIHALTLVMVVMLTPIVMNTLATLALLPLIGAAGIIFGRFYRKPVLNVIMKLSLILGVSGLISFFFLDPSGSLGGRIIATIVMALTSLSVLKTIPVKRSMF